MLTTTYNQIITAFDAYCTKHMQINTFHSGKQWNFQTETNIYPAVILLPITSLINRGRIVLNFNVFVADILNADRTNLDDIYSDTLQILTDIISNFSDVENDNAVFYLDETTVSIEPFEETLDDVIAGWVATVAIEVPFSGNSCIAPIDI